MPAASPIAASAVIEHAVPAFQGDLDPFAELRALTAALRSHLGWLREGGVTGLPRPAAGSRPRAAVAVSGSVSGSVPGASADPPTPAAVRPAAPPVAEHTLPPVHPAALAHEAEDAAAAARAAVQASARTASASTRGPAPRGESAPPPVAPRAPLTLPVYPELEDPRLAALPAREALAEIRQILGDCRRCNLCHGRTNVVFGDGTPEPWLVFVGEGPGADEDRIGQPFVGAAGELLNRMIDAMGKEASKRGLAELSAHLSRQEVYIANVVKCRPPGNRPPEPDEVATCSPFLLAQLRSLRPRVIVALGRTPAHFLLQTTAPMSQLRGHFRSWNGIPLMPTYHPAYLLRTPSAKQQVWEDLKSVIEQLSRPPAIPITS
jgi:DNA polymerase